MITELVNVNSQLHNIKFRITGKIVVAVLTHLMLK